jgi:hypothetical protein
MSGRKKPETKEAGLENLSLNSARRSGGQNGRLERPGRKSGRNDSTESSRAPDQQIPKR